MMKLVSVKGSLKRLEPYDGKLSRTVLRGREDSNISPVTRHYRNKQYGIHQQVNNQNELLYPFNQLISKYNFKTQSPWVGLSVNSSLTDKFQIIPTIKFYSFKYVGKGYWLLRDELRQNPSFKHTAKGAGLGFDMDFSYKYSNNLDFKINLETKKFKIKKGKDKSFFKNKVREDLSSPRNLMHLSLISFSISAGFRYKI